MKHDFIISTLIKDKYVEKNQLEKVVEMWEEYKESDYTYFYLFLKNNYPIIYALLPESCVTASVVLSLLIDGA